MWKTRNIRRRNKRNKTKRQDGGLLPFMGPSIAKIIELAIKGDMEVTARIETKNGILSKAKISDPIKMKFIKGKQLQFIEDEENKIDQINASIKADTRYKYEIKGSKLEVTLKGSKITLLIDETSIKNIKDKKKIEEKYTFKSLYINSYFKRNKNGTPSQSLNKKCSTISIGNDIFSKENLIKYNAEICFIVESLKPYAEDKLVLLDIENPEDKIKIDIADFVENGTISKDKPYYEYFAYVSSGRDDDSLVGFMCYDKQSNPNSLKVSNLIWADNENGKNPDLRNKMYAIFDNELTGKSIQAKLFIPDELDEKVNVEVYTKGETKDGFTMWDVTVPRVPTEIEIKIKTETNQKAIVLLENLQKLQLLFKEKVNSFNIQSGGADNVLLDEIITKYPSLKGLKSMIDDLPEDIQEKYASEIKTTLEKVKESNVSETDLMNKPEFQEIQADLNAQFLKQKEDEPTVESNEGETKTDDLNVEPTTTEGSTTEETKTDEPTAESNEGETKTEGPTTPEETKTEGPTTTEDTKTAESNEGETTTEGPTTTEETKTAESNEGETTTEGPTTTEETKGDPTLESIEGETKTDEPTTTEETKTDEPTVELNEGETKEKTTDEKKTDEPKSKEGKTKTDESNVESKKEEDEGKPSDKTKEGESDTTTTTVVTPSSSSDEVTLKREDLKESPLLVQPTTGESGKYIFVPKDLVEKVIDYLLNNGCEVTTVNLK
jgi:hypothetical protein